MAWNEQGFHKIGWLLRLRGPGHPHQHIERHSIRFRILLPLRFEIRGLARGHVAKAIKIQAATLPITVRRHDHGNLKHLRIRGTNWCAAQIRTDRGQKIHRRAFLGAFLNDIQPDGQKRKNGQHAKGQDPHSYRDLDEGERSLAAMERRDHGSWSIGEYCSAGGAARSLFRRVEVPRQIPEAAPPDWLGEKTCISEQPKVRLKRQAGGFFDRYKP